MSAVGVVLACYARTDELTFSVPRLVELVHQRMTIDSADERAFWHTVQFWTFLAMAVMTLSAAPEVASRNPGVSVGPGHTVLAVMPNSLFSAAILWISEASATLKTL